MERKESDDMLKQITASVDASIDEVVRCTRSLQKFECVVASVGGVYHP